MRFTITDFHSGTPNMVEITTDYATYWRILDPIVIAKILELQEKRD